MNKWQWGLLGTLFVVIVGSTLQHRELYAKGYFLHLAVFAAYTVTACMLLREEGEKTTIGRLMVVLGLIIFSVTSLELGFEIYRRKPFDEPGLVTLLSICQLLTVSILAMKVFCLRKGDNPFAGIKAQYVIWFIIGMGFLYLAFDEKMLFHEGIDRTGHKILHMSLDSISSRADDVLVGIYGIVALFVLNLYKKEIKLFRKSLRYFHFGFGMLFASVICDVTASNIDFFSWVFENQETAHAVFYYTNLVEEIFKLMGESFFLTALYKCLLLLRSGEIAGFEPAPADPEPIS